MFTIDLMAMLFPNLKAVIFDYVNTLIPFGKTEIQGFDRQWTMSLHELFGPAANPPQSSLYAWRPQISGDDDEKEEEESFRAIPAAELCGALAEDVYQRKAGRGELNTMLKSRFHAFLANAHAPGFVHDVLESLHPRYLLALISDEPDDYAVHKSIENLNLAKYFATVITGNDVGHLLPNKRGLEVILRELHAKPDETLFIGSLPEHIMAAKAAGLHTIHNLQWASDIPGNQSGDDGGYADEIINHLNELGELL